MIWMAQNRLHYTGDYMSKSSSVLSTDYYPEQNLNFLNKLLFVPYRDENQVTTNFRLYIPKNLRGNFDGKSGPWDNFTKVLRFDLGEPYKAVLVDKNDYIIVADTRKLLKYTVYPGYDSFRGYPEADMNMTETWEEFNEEYNSEKMWIIHVQNPEFLGQPVWIEYYKDIIDKEYDWSDIHKEYVHDHPDARYQFDKLNMPLRAKQRGYIIRADENGTEAEIVVMVEDEETDTRKYILGSEAFFYLNTDEPKKTIKELNIWQPV